MKVLGARFEAVIAPPTVFTFSRAAGGRDTSINVGTFLGGIFAWDLATISASATWRVSTSTS